MQFSSYLSILRVHWIFICISWGFLVLWKGIVMLVEWMIMRRYTSSGYVFLLGEGAISWKSTKQSCIARSIMEVEFIALTLAEQEADWLRIHLIDVLLWGYRGKLISLLSDLESSCSVSLSKVYNGKKRSIWIRHSAMRHLLKHSVVSLDLVRSKDNLVDPSTKGFSGRVILDMSRGIGLKPIQWGTVRFPISMAECSYEDRTHVKFLMT